MSIRRRYPTASGAVAAPFAILVFSQTNSANPGTIVGIWSDLRAIRAIDSRTGELLWETDDLGWAWGTPAVTSDTIYIYMCGRQKYVTTHEAGLAALDRKTGTVRWRRPVRVDPAAVVSGYPGSVAVLDGMVVAPNVGGTLEGTG